MYDGGGRAKRQIESAQASLLEFRRPTTYKSGSRLSAGTTYDLFERCSPNLYIYIYIAIFI